MTIDVDAWMIDDGSFDDPDRWVYTIDDETTVTLVMDADTVPVWPPWNAYMRIDGRSLRVREFDATAGRCLAVAADVPMCEIPQPAQVWREEIYADGE